MTIRLPSDYVASCREQDRELAQYEALGFTYSEYVARTRGLSRKDGLTIHEQVMEDLAALRRAAA